MFQQLRRLCCQRTNDDGAEHSLDIRELPTTNIAREWRASKQQTQEIVEISGEVLGPWASKFVRLCGNKSTARPKGFPLTLLQPASSVPCANQGYANQDKLRITCLLTHSIGNTRTMQVLRQFGLVSERCQFLSTINPFPTCLSFPASFKPVSSVIVVLRFFVAFQPPSITRRSDLIVFTHSSLA